MSNERRPGFVYVMTAPGFAGVKIGRSERAPHFRARELCNDPGYGKFGHWEVVDYREVIDPVSTERTLHARFASENARGCGTPRELFRIDVAEAVNTMIETAEAGLVGRAPLGRLRLDASLLRYLAALFASTGLTQFLDCQEMWTFSLYPSTAGGRLFTVNIDRHEVAFASAIRGDGSVEFMLHADCLIHDAPKQTGDWFRKRHGTVEEQPYSSGHARGLSLYWKAPLDDAADVFSLPLTRRALLAYWYDSLLDLRDRGKRSFFARHHNHNAVQELLRFTAVKDAQ